MDFHPNVIVGSTDCVIVPSNLAKLTTWKTIPMTTRKNIRTTKPIAALVDT
ncbi:hypothetical protein BH18THE2_BH18THE2_24320 [soil metagenome]